MKELSIEEKAKRYDEILEGAKYYYESLDSNTIDCVFEELIPELKESYDEQIRKYLIDVVNDYCKGREHDGCIAWLEKQGEQKPAWSKEDEEMLEDIRFNYEFNKSGMTKGLIEQYNKWFEKIKSLKPQPKQEWSEEDEWRLKNVISRIKEFGDSSAFGLINNDIQWLKSLKGKVKPQNLTVEELDQAKKDAYNDALDKIEYHSVTPTFEDGWSAAIWYLKKRDILKSQSTWKPSEEQMDALETAVSSLQSTALESLYNELKKL